MRNSTTQKHHYAGPYYVLLRLYTPFLCIHIHKVNVLKERDTSIAKTLLNLVNRQSLKYRSATCYQAFIFIWAPSATICI